MAPQLDSEYILSMVETRMRQMVSDLVTPTIDRVTAHGHELQILHAQGIEQGEQIVNLRQAQTKLREAEATMRNFEAHMESVKRSMHDASARSLEDREAVEREMVSLKSVVHRNEEHIMGFRRVLQEVSMEVTRLQVQLKESQEIFPDKLDEQRREAHMQKCELEVKISQLELQHTALTDELWGEELGLARVRGEMRKASDLLGEFRTALAELQAATVRPEDLQRVHEDATRQISVAMGQVQALDKLVGETAQEVKEHLQTSIKAAGTHYAAFAEEVRRSYTTELQQSTDLRKEVERTMVEVRERLAASDRTAEEFAQRSETLIGELRETIDLAERRRKGDRSSADLELKGLKSRIGAMSDHNDTVLRGFDRLSGVLGMTLDACRVQCALELQDNADRESLHLLGLREEQQPAAAAPAAPPPPQAPANPQGSPGRSPRRLPTKGSRPPIMSVDQRCLSCSGQARTVLSAFKVACLQYNPSPVAWEESEHSRSELLRHLSGLLEKAHTGFSALADQSSSLAPAPAPPPPHAAGERPRQQVVIAPAAGGAHSGAAALKEYSSLLNLTSKAEDRDTLRKLPSLSKTVHVQPNSGHEASELT